MCACACRAGRLIHSCSFCLPCLPAAGLDSGSFYPYIVGTLIATAISTVFVVAPLLIAPSRVDLDKSSAYECGFDAFGEVRALCAIRVWCCRINQKVRMGWTRACTDAVSSRNLGHLPLGVAMSLGPQSSGLNFAMAF